MDILCNHVSLIIDGFAITEHRLPENKPELNEQRVHMGCDAEINLAVSHKASQRAEECVGIFTHSTRITWSACVQRKFASSSASQTREGKGEKMGVE